MRFAKLKQVWLIAALICLIVGIGQASALPQQQGALSQVITTGERGISVHTPAGWQFRSVAYPLYSSLLAFGDSGPTLQAVVNSFSTGTNPSGFQGSYGLVGVFSPALYNGLDINVAAQSFFQALTSSQVGIQVNAQQNQTFGGGQYPGLLALVSAPANNTSGFIGVFTDGTNIGAVILGVSPSANLQTVQSMFGDMLNSVRMPAEPNAITTPPQGLLTPVAPLATPTTGLNLQPVGTPVPALPTQSGAPGTTTLVRASGDAFSLELPTGWVVEDHLADLKVFAYGDSTAAVQSRLASLQPNAPGVTGSGGLVRLFTPAELGLGDTIDANALMGQVLTNVQNQGFTVQEDIQVLPMDEGAMLYAVVSGPENGFLALAFVPGQIVYLTATGDSRTFQAYRGMFYTIVQSLHVPAASEGGGGGNLGNPFATATPGGGGGIGLPLATVAPSATVGSGQIVPVQTATESGGQIVPATPTATEGSGHIVPVAPTPTT